MPNKLTRSFGRSPALILCHPLLFTDTHTHAHTCHSHRKHIPFRTLLANLKLFIHSFIYLFILFFRVCLCVCFLLRPFCRFSAAFIVALLSKSVKNKQNISISKINRLKNRNHWHLRVSIFPFNSYFMYK